MRTKEEWIALFQKIGVRDPEQVQNDSEFATKANIGPEADIGDQMPTDRSHPHQ
jgi:hypothetical protein